ncbi:LysM peptidoglycan-binding domain-containing protein [Streptomyces noursei]|uniref:LysM peptidoglycan-binding domain-containing protein n=1 Tax=Streptomyces noursei TaxID=1971 RepID=UPI00344D2170
MSQVSTVISVALGEVGYQAERAPGERPSGHQKYSQQVPGLEWSNYQPWCATWTSWVAMKAGVANLFPRTASVYTAMQWFKDKGRWNAYPAIGAQVIYGTSGSTHTGICVGFDSTWIYTVEGNTSLTNDANGNGVMKRQRRRRDAYVHGYGYPKYAEGITTADPSKKGLAGYAYAAAASSPATSSDDSTGKYKIKKGQTLSGIAALLGVSLAALLAANPQIKSPDRVDEGQEITVPTTPKPPTKPTAPPAKPTPKPDKPTSPPTTGDFYTVQKGDSLSSIARAFVQSLTALLARNPSITNPNVIQTGQQIRVKATVPRAAPKTVFKPTGPRRTAPKPTVPAPAAKPKTHEPEKPVTVVVRCECTCDCCGPKKPIPQPSTEPSEARKTPAPSKPPEPPAPPTVPATPAPQTPGPGHEVK